MNEQEHSPTPWRESTDEYLKSGNIVVLDANGRRAGAYSGDDPLSRANGRHVIRCVNVHDDLVAACVAMLGGLQEIAAPTPLEIGQMKMLTCVISAAKGSQEMSTYEKGGAS